MKKTSHRLLHDVLEPEVYAKVMRNFDKCFHLASFLNAKKPSHALFNAFAWRRSPEGFEYWESIHEKLQEQEND